MVLEEAVIESAFIESYQMITDKHKNVLEEFLNRTEEALHKHSTASDIEKTKKELERLKKKLDNLLDMHLEGKIDFGTYEQKKTELEKSITGKQPDLKILQSYCSHLT